MQHYEFFVQSVDGRNKRARHVCEVLLTMTNFLNVLVPLVVEYEQWKYESVTIDSPGIYNLRWWSQGTDLFTFDNLSNQELCAWIDLCYPAITTSTISRQNHILQFPIKTIPRLSGCVNIVVVTEPATIKLCTGSFSDQFSLTITKQFD